MKKLLYSFLLALFFIMLISCSRTNQDESNVKLSESDHDIPVVGFSMDTLVVDRWRKDRDAVSRIFQERGMNIIIRDARNSAELQKKQVEDLVEIGIDLLIIIPHDSEFAAEAIAPAQKKEIPVICYDRLIREAGTDAYVSFNNSEVGRIIMEELINHVPEGNFIVINGSPLDYNSKMLRDGAMEAFSTSFDSDKIKISGETWAKDWSSDFSYKYVSDLLYRGNNFDAVWAANDNLAEAAIQALSEHRRAGIVYVGGQDADLGACQRLVEGTQVVTVYKPIDKLATLTADIAEALLGDTSIPKDYELINDGFTNIPYYKVEVQKVTKGNISETIIKSGVYSRDLIYQNVLNSPE